jgi:hypothetical protein
LTFTLSKTLVEVAPIAGRLRWLMYSQRRYPRTCESLARIRKLSKGSQFVQVNIATEGRQQVNAMCGVNGTINPPYES